jgi:hypothetical protein
VNGDELDPNDLTDTESPFNDLDLDFDASAEQDLLEVRPEEYQAVDPQSAGSIVDEVSPEPVFSTLEEFVGDYLLFFYRRRVTANTGAWCPQWWRHPEAHLRLNELWRSWEHLRLDEATGIAVWLRDFADPFMAVLLSPDGPMAGCTPDGHSTHMTLEPLPAVPHPDDHALAGFEGCFER